MITKKTTIVFRVMPTNALKTLVKHVKYRDLIFKITIFKLQQI
jgi:hypothetical protein